MLDQLRFLMTDKTVVLLSIIKHILIYRTHNLGNKILEKLETNQNFTRSVILLKAFMMVQLIDYEISNGNANRHP